MISRERWVVKAPVKQVIACRVEIPFTNWQVDSDFLPVPLCLEVSKHGRLALARIRMPG